MNNTNQLTKGNAQINSTLRATGSGRLKRPSRDLGSLNTSSKKPFLKQYSIAMEQKLQNLKQKISEKKKQKIKQQSLIPNKKALDQKLEKFLKTKLRPEQKNLQETIQVQINKQKMSNFLAQNNLLSYQGLLAENQIDSLEILADATQKQLQEIGIPKGHALKLKVNISKWSQCQVPQDKQKILRETKTKDSDRNNSFVSVNNKNNSPNTDSKQPNQAQKKVQSICIGTQQDGIQSITFVSTSKSPTISKAQNKFCMFCYQSIKVTNLADCEDFCSQDCLQRYNQMFKKYQNNLVKAEEQFMNKNTKPLLGNKKEEHNEQPQQNEDDQQGYDFLENQDNYEDFNYQDYAQLKKELGND